MPEFDAKKALKERDKKIQKQKDELDSLREKNQKAETQLSELSDKLSSLEKRLGGGDKEEDKYELTDDDYTPDGGLKQSGIEKLLSKKMEEFKPKSGDSDFQEKIDKTLSDLKKEQLDDEFDLSTLISDEDGDFYKYANETKYNVNDPSSGSILENIKKFIDDGSFDKIKPILKNYSSENQDFDRHNAGFSKGKQVTPEQKNREKEIAKLQKKADELLKSKKYNEAMEVDEQITQLKSEGA